MGDEDHRRRKGLSLGFNDSLSPSGQPKTLSPMGPHSPQNLPAVAAGGSGQAPLSPFYSHIPPALPPLLGDSSPYDPNLPPHHSPYSSQHPSSFAPHHSMYSAFPGPRLAPPGSVGVHAFGHQSDTGVVSGDSDYNSFSSHNVPHNAAASASSSRRNTNPPSPSAESLASEAISSTLSKGKFKGISGIKARIPREAKIAIAEHIIAKGVAMANVEELSRIASHRIDKNTLIKSQLVDNRQNIRKQMVEFVRNLQ
nr:hypothetical protein L204_02872 [Cryptococcus depauperatus CBS 7855]